MTILVMQKMGGIFTTTAKNLAYGNGVTLKGVRFRARATRDDAGNTEIDRDDFIPSENDGIEVFDFDDEGVINAL